MATDVVMPQMGESIAEGTIVRWIKKVGESVERDEPLFEISTDKVDAEIPSPVAGVVTEIRAKEGETVPVNSVVAVIGAPGSAASVTPSQPTPVTSVQPAPVTPAPVAAPRPVAIPASQPAAATATSVAATPASPAPLAAASNNSAPASRGEPESVSEARKRERAPESAGDAIRHRSSPLVRNIAKEHHVDISGIRGTGIAGRVTKDDILAFLDARPATARAGAEPALSQGVRRGQDDSSVSAIGADSAPSVARAPRPTPSPGSPAVAGLPGRVMPMSVMRK